MAKETHAVSVLRRQNVSPNLTRLVLHGQSLQDFPSGFEGGYIKFVFPDGSEKPPKRSYTIKAFDPVKRALTVEIVSHGDDGPAARWANRVAEGDTISIIGPGACQPISTDADWFLLAGDMSAMPAVLVNLARLPADAAGYVVLEVMSEADKREVNLPSAMQLKWVVNPDPSSENSVLEDTVMALPWLEGKAAVWVAGEFSASRTLRQYFRHQRKVSKDGMYVSCYWKIGTNDEGMKAAKRADPEPW